MKKLRILPIILLAFFLLTVVCYGSDQFTPLTVICGGKNLSTGYEYHGNFYITLDDFNTYGDSSGLNIDTDSNKVTFDPADLDLFLADSETTGFIQEYAEEVHFFLRTIDTKKYVPIKILAQFGKLDYELEGDTLYLYPLYQSGTVYQVRKTVTAAASLLDGSGSTVTVAEGQLCRLVESGKVFSKVRLLYGDTVWLMNDCFTKVNVSAVQVPDYRYTAKDKTDYSDRCINMVWDDNPGGAPDPGEGVDVICAFNWFSAEVDKDGYVGTNANKGYSDSCHENGYEVWATVTNNFHLSGSTKYTTKVLADERLRNKVIAQYLFYAMVYDVDGINIDYEDLVSADKKNLTAFVKTFSEYTNRMGITLSVATLVPESWNFSIYEYEYLGKLADFITVMAYDEHYAVSSGAGSTSSKGWYTRNLQTLTKIVDSRKILFGIPFYSFVNKYTGGTFSCAKWSTKTVRTYLDKADAEGRILTGPVWQENDGQYYVEYVDSSGQTTYKIWMEDERSVMTRIKTVCDLNLGGTACWELDQMSYAIHDLFHRVYHLGESPDEILQTLALEAE